MKTPRDVEGDLATEELVDPTGASPTRRVTAPRKVVAGRSPWEIFWRQFRKDRWALAGIVIVVIMLTAGHHRAALREDRAVTVPTT